MATLATLLGGILSILTAIGYVFWFFGFYLLNNLVQKEVISNISAAMKIIYTLCLTFALSVSADRWIDPHDMNTNAKQKYGTATIKRSTSTSSIDVGSSDLAPDICYAHLRRIVSVLINSAHIDKRDPEQYHGNIRFTMDPKEFDFLANFGKANTITLEMLRKLDTVLSESFKRTSIDEYLDTLESYQLKLYLLIVNSKNIWLIGSACMLYVVYQLFKNNFSLTYILKYLLIIILIADFGFRYHYLLEEAEEHNLGVAYSKDCDPKQMSWGEWTKYIFSPKNCEKKTVTPLDAFLYQVKNLIIIPMHAFGTGMGGFGKNMFTNLPWGLNLIMWPILVIFTLLILLFIMTICTGQSIEFNIFHLVKFKFGGGSQRENLLRGSTVERLMNNVLHRPMVQNINVSLPANEKSTSISNESEKSDLNAANEKPLSVTCDKGTNTAYVRNTVESDNLEEEKCEETVTGDKVVVGEETVSNDRNIGDGDK